MLRLAFLSSGSRPPAICPLNSFLLCPTGTEDLVSTLVWLSSQTNKKGPIPVSWGYRDFPKYSYGFQPLITDLVTVSNHSLCEGK